MSEIAVERVTYSRLVIGDRVQVMAPADGEWQVWPAPKKAPKRAYWATVIMVNRTSEGITVMIEDVDGSKIDLHYRAAHTAITREIATPDVEHNVLGGRDWTDGLIATVDELLAKSAVAVPRLTAIRHPRTGTVHASWGGGKAACGSSRGVEATGEAVTCGRCLENYAAPVAEKAAPAPLTETDTERLLAEIEARQTENVNSDGLSVPDEAVDVMQQLWDAGRVVSGAQVSGPGGRHGYYSVRLIEKDHAEAMRMNATLSPEEEAQTYDVAIGECLICGRAYMLTVDLRDHYTRVHGVDSSQVTDTAERVAVTGDERIHRTTLARIEAEDWVQVRTVDGPHPEAAQWAFVALAYPMGREVNLTLGDGGMLVGNPDTEIIRRERKDEAQVSAETVAPVAQAPSWVRDAWTDVEDTMGSAWGQPLVDDEEAPASPVAPEFRQLTPEEALAELSDAYGAPLPVITIEKPHVSVDASIEHVTDYAGHWRGEAWLSHHRYGVQAHRSLDEARRWCEGRVAVVGEGDLLPAFDVPVLSAAEVSGLDASAGAVAVHQAAARLGRVPRKVKKSAKRRLAQHR